MNIVFNQTQLGYGQPTKGQLLLRQIGVDERIWFGDLKNLLDKNFGSAAYWALTNIQIIYGWSDRTPVYSLIDKILPQIRKQDFIFVKNYTIAHVRLTLSPNLLPRQQRKSMVNTQGL